MQGVVLRRSIGGGGSRRGVRGAAPGRVYSCQVAWNQAGRGGAWAGAELTKVYAGERPDGPAMTHLPSRRPAPKRPWAGAMASGDGWTGGTWLGEPWAGGVARCGPRHVGVSRCDPRGGGGAVDAREREGKARFFGADGDDRR